MVEEDNDPLKEKKKVDEERRKILLDVLNVAKPKEEISKLLETPLTVRSENYHLIQEFILNDVKKFISEEVWNDIRILDTTAKKNEW